MIATIRYEARRDSSDVVFLCASHDCTLLLPNSYTRAESSRIEADCAVCEFTEKAPSEMAAIEEARARGMRLHINIEATLKALADIAAQLNETAAGLDDKSIHPAHAANRLRKMARGIDGGK